MKLIEVIKNAFRVGELRKKILMTLLLVVIFRIGCFIPVPGLSSTALEGLNSGLFRFMDLLSGGAFQSVSLFALGISPYINASIIMQLLTVAIPALERLQKEGEEGRKKITQATRYVAIGLALFQSIMLYFNINNSNATVNLFAAAGKFDVLTFLMIVAAFTAGTTVLMWLGEKITEVGIGNGISMLIFAGIVANAPGAIKKLWGYIFGKSPIDYASDVRLYENRIFCVIAVLGILLVFLAVILAVVWMEGGERRIPVQYAKRVVGRKIYGGQNTHIPLKVNSSGVLPIIFAMSLLQFPATIAAFVDSDGSAKISQFINEFSQGNSWTYVLVYSVLIVLFTFFYNIVYFDPNDIANNLKKNGGFVPGLRPGAPTAEFIRRSSTRITWFGAFFLAILAVFPNTIPLGAKLVAKILEALNLGTHFVAIGNINMWIGGTTVLILVGVALETARQLEAQLLMRNYKGFLD